MRTQPYSLPSAYNEPVLSYAPGSPEKKQLKELLALWRSTLKEMPMIIGGRKVFTDTKVSLHPPHDIKHTLGYYYLGDAKHVHQAIEAALQARKMWYNMPWRQRASIFLKTASLASGSYRQHLNASTMLGQSKNVYQAEIDAVCEFADFLRFNVQFMEEIYSRQPLSGKDVWNRMEIRPLEGFVYALSPFNFTSLAANLAAAPALMGNVVVWKPSRAQLYSATVLMEIFKEAGLPDGVINMINVSGEKSANIVLQHPDFAGLHFTGSTEVFKEMWKKISSNIDRFRNYPKIVGETGGKGFIIAHKSADKNQLIAAIIRGAFEYQGQKCSAASRGYIPSSLWGAIKDELLLKVKSLKMGGVENFKNFVNAVIDMAAFDKIAAYLEAAKKDADVEIIAGGSYDKSTGYFIEPAIIVSRNPHYVSMEEEIFGPVFTLYVYDDDEYAKTLDLADATSPYALTGAVFAQDRKAVELASEKLCYAAGNFYINDKPTGAVVGQQPFGGARASGTNDKSGSYLNLLRWASPRTIKENFNPPLDHSYPFMEEE